MKIHPQFIGCDVSKHHLDIFDAGEGATRRIVNDPQTIATWLDGLPERAERHVVFEATGRYDRHLSAALHRRRARPRQEGPLHGRADRRARLP